MPLLTRAGPSKSGPAETGVLGVLDLDSPLPGRFDTEDQAGCEALAAIVVRYLTPAPIPPS